MHHILLLTPILALVLFLVLPWPSALLLYLPIAIGSLIAFRKVMQAMRRPSVTGERAMIGDRAVVVKATRSHTEVHYRGESWRAVSSQPLQRGQEVIIEGVDGLTLRVTPLPYSQTINA